MSNFKRVFPWLLLVAVLFFWVKSWSNWKKQPPKTIIKEERVEIPVPVESIKWREKIIYREVAPETVIIDTTAYDRGVLPYERMWGIIELRKKNRDINFKYYRSSEDYSSIYLRQNYYRLGTGKEFAILPTDNPENPFFFKEKRDLFGYKLGGGYSFQDFVYITSGIYLQGIGKSNFYGDLGISSYLSVKRQDIRLEFLLR